MSGFYRGPMDKCPLPDSRAKTLIQLTKAHRFLQTGGERVVLYLGSRTDVSGKANHTRSFNSFGYVSERNVLIIGLKSDTELFRVIPRR